MVKEPSASKVSTQYEGRASGSGVNEREKEQKRRSDIRDTHVDSSLQTARTRETIGPFVAPRRTRTIANRSAPQRRHHPGPLGVFVVGRTGQSSDLAVFARLRDDRLRGFSHFAPFHATKHNSRRSSLVNGLVYSRGAGTSVPFCGVVSLERSPSKCGTTSDVNSQFYGEDS